MYLRYGWDGWQRLLDADGASAGGGTAGDTAGQADASDDDDGDDGDAQRAPADRTFTQAELDRIIERRLKRERRAWETQLEEERKKAQMTEAEKLAAEKKAAEDRAKGAIEQANQRAIQAEAKVQAAALGIKPERIAYALRLADLSEVSVDEDGEPDAAAVKAAIEQVLTAIPELKGAAAAGNVGGGTNPPGAGNAGTNPWSKEHFNLTEQARVLREDPARAKRLQEAARG